VPYPIDDKLVIAVASSALFDLTESDEVFRERGEDQYRAYQRANENDHLRPGVAFPFVRRLVAFNRALPDLAPIEIVLLSRNDPDTGLRVMRSIEHHRLGISRAAFVSGRNPYRYMDGFNACLFLSANAADVRAAIETGLPAGLVFPTEYVDDEEDELRIAFDFDGVLADDSAERVFQQGELALFHHTEDERRAEALGDGPLRRLLTEIARVQEIERARADADPEYRKRLRTAIVTARNAPAHERVVTTLRKWGVAVDEAFFLGGVDKSRILREYRPHLFFDDQLSHVRGAAPFVPSVHVPFGVTNEVGRVQDTSSGTPAGEIIAGSATKPKSKIRRSGAA
jgi:5'-nucleotidase